VLISSHVLAEVARTVDRVIVMSAGEVRFTGPLDDLSGPDALEAAFLRLTGQDTPEEVRP
jgi:ABC-2 type transport system ATP-binding protein